MRLSPLHRSALPLACLLALAGCGKAVETATEKAIEAQASQDGVKAKVDLNGGQAKITTTDDKGQVSQAQLGGAKIGEAELGVPIYPGAKPDEAGGSKVSTPQGDMVMAQFKSGDAPDKVAAFYREHLRAQSSGKQFMDASSGDGGATLMLGDDAGKRAVQIQISRDDAGSTFMIQATQSK